MKYKKEKDIVVKLFKSENPDELIYVIRTPNHHTGNLITNLAKLANAITDGPVLMAAKSHLRNQKPALVGISTNDGLGASAKNIGLLLNTKYYFFIPFGQDDPIKKPNSLVCHSEFIVDSVEHALRHEQIQPILV